MENIFIVNCLIELSTCLQNFCKTINQLYRFVRNWAPDNENGHIKGSIDYESGSF